MDLLVYSSYIYMQLNYISNMTTNQFNNLEFINNLILVTENLDYKIFKDGKVNIIGIRNKIHESNKFNDSLFLFWYENDQIISFKFKITTEPGLTSLLKPINKNGCGILVEGQYEDIYSIDIHAKGKLSEHEALCQRLGPVRVYRDNNKNSTIDLNIKSIELAYGINIHRASNKMDITSQINSYSAGCQVFENRLEFKIFMDIIKSKKEIHNNKFTYTLIEETTYLSIQNQLKNENKKNASTINS